MIADQPHLQYYPHMSIDYKHTDIYIRLVMTLLCSKQLAVIAVCCTQQSRAPYINCCARKLALTSDLDPIFDHDLKVKVM